jgi:hypothetical protein
MSLEGEIGNLCHHSIGRMPSDRYLGALMQASRSRCVSSCFEDSGLRRRTPVRPVLLTGQTGLELLHLHLQFNGLGIVDQPRNLVVFW